MDNPTTSRVCKKIYNNALAIAPTDGTQESLEFGIEVARQELSWDEDISCGITTGRSEITDFRCDKPTVYCPLSHIVKRGYE
jgi:hypothetical protein